MNKFTKLNEAVLSFINKNIAKIMGIVILGVVLSWAISFSSYNKPETAAEFANTTTMIVNFEKSTGGTGVILKSTSSGSVILTNKHICKLVERGGLVIHEGRDYMVSAYKKYPKHDLCLVHVIYDLGVNTKIASYRPDDFAKASISGHPGLMPPVLTNGYFSGRERIQLIVGLKKCDKNTPKKYLMYCFTMGGVPIIENFDSQLVTATILPGSSGSGVFNESGELAGLVFAGRGRGLMYAYIVPHEYLVDFMDIERDLPWNRAGLGLDYKKFFKSIFNFQDKCFFGVPMYRNACKSVKDYMIWRK